MLAWTTWVLVALPPVGHDVELVEPDGALAPVCAPALGLTVPWTPELPLAW